MDYVLRRTRWHPSHEQPRRGHRRFDRKGLCGGAISTRTARQCAPEVGEYRDKPGKLASFRPRTGPAGWGRNETGAQPRQGTRPPCGHSGAGGGSAFPCALPNPVKVSFGERCGRRIGSLQEPSSKLRREFERLALLVAHAAKHGIRQAAPAAASLSARKCLLIWVATYANMGSHTMKTTIEISDDLFARTQAVARKEKTTFRSLTERGLRLVLEEKLTRSSKWRWKAVVVQGGEGLTDEFKRAPWKKIRDAIYQGHGT